MLTHSRLKRLGPIVLVGVVLAAAMLGVGNFFTRTSQDFAFSAYWPQPGTPTGNDADVVLHINYTGPTLANFTYVISYVDSSGVVVAGQNEVQVGDFPFSAYLYVPVPEQGVVATATVYRGAISPLNLVFTKSIEL